MDWQIVELQSNLQNRQIRYVYLEKVIYTYYPVEAKVDICMYTNSYYPPGAKVNR